MQRLIKHVAKQKCVGESFNFHIDYDKQTSYVWRLIYILS